MTLAMDMLEYVEENKDVWFAQGRAEGEAKGRAEGEAKGRAEGEAKGRAEGKAEGRAEGWKDGIANVALKMLHRGVPIEYIIEDTGLTAAEIEALRTVQ